MTNATVRAGRSAAARMGTPPVALASPLIFFALFALLPLFVAGTSDAFLLNIAGRILVIALAAVTLDLLLGYGGMVSFGHAAFIGIGAYAMGISSEHGVDNLLLTVPLTLAVCGGFALLMGLIAIRTSGIQFIMITLALSQMVFFAVASLARYGGDDGLTLWGRSTLAGLPVFDDPVAYYFAILAVLGAVYVLCHAVVRSRFGRVLQGIRQSPERMAALGYDVNRFRLVAFVVAGSLCGLSGFLLANLTEFVSPAAMSWGRSADLIIILVLGGIGRLHGALWGALVFFGLEEALPILFRDLAAPAAAGLAAVGAPLEAAALSLAEHWRVVFGPILILVALYARGGLVGLFERRRTA